MLAGMALLELDTEDGGAEVDRGLAVEVARVHAEQFGVYGGRKVWRQLAREGIPPVRVVFGAKWGVNPMSRIWATNPAVS